MSSDIRILRPTLQLDREFGTHRNCWVREPRIVGNALSVLLYLLSHREGHAVTQTHAQSELGLGKDAWMAAKYRLMEAGF